MPTEFTDLIEIRASIETDRVMCRRYRYYVKVTDQNYLPQIPPDDTLEKKYSHAGLFNRLDKSKLMKVERSIFDDHDTCIRRSIYCLESDQEVALKSVIESLGEAVKKKHEYATKLLDAWNARDK
jgi:hypothetical protein